MKKILAIIISLVITMSSFATKHNHDDKNEVRYINGKRELNTQYQDYLRILDQLKEAKATKISIANPPPF